MKDCLNRLTRIGWLALGAVLIFGALSAKASPICVISGSIKNCTVTYTTPIPSQATSWGPTLYGIQGFDSSLGTLTGVSVVEDVNINATVVITNTVLE